MVQVTEERPIKKTTIRSGESMEAYIEKVKSNPAEVARIEDFVVKENSVLDKEGHVLAGQALVEKIVAESGSGEIKIPLFSGLDWKEFKVKNWKPYVRSCKYTAYATFRHPKIEEVAGDLATCAAAAAVVGGIGAVVSNGAAFTAAFKVSFDACLVAKGVSWASDIDVNVGADSECEEWKKV